MEELIRFEEIDKSFKTHKVLDKLNLAINKGELVGLIGKSGEGKTTLLRVLIGFYGIDNGKIIFNGEDITENTSKIREIVGFCTQDNSFYPELTIKENLFYYGRLYSIKKKKLKQQVEHLLNLVNLEQHKNKLAGKISGGMKRRLDFAISLLHEPGILILDEPTTGLDPIIRKAIWELIEKINKEGKTIIVSTHLLDFVEEKCSAIVVINKGKTYKLRMADLRKAYPKEKNLTYIFSKLFYDDANLAKLIKKDVKK